MEQSGVPGDAVVVSLPHTANGSDVRLHQVVLGQILKENIRPDLLNTGGNVFMLLLLGFRFRYLKCLSL